MSQSHNSTRSGGSGSLIGVAAAAEVLGVTDKVVYALIQRKELDAVRIGGQIRLHRSVVLEAQRFGTRPNTTRPYTTRKPRTPEVTADVADSK